MNFIPIINVCHAGFLSVGPSCAIVCRRGNIQWFVPHCLRMAKWPFQNSHFWLQVRSNKDTWPFSVWIMSFQYANNIYELFFILYLSTRSSRSVLMNLMMSDENNRDIYITIASMPPSKPCSKCCPVPSATTIRTGNCVHRYILLPSLG